MVNWVEKASLEKIRSLLKISEPERHYEVLLTLKNLDDVRRILALYSLSIIPHLFPSEIADGEHFVTTDLLSLITGSSSPSRNLEAETSNREQASRASSEPSASTSGDSSPAPPGANQGEKVSSQQGFLYQEKGLTLPPEF